ncbi:hypothetical protein V6Z12_D12G070900 [Gossypium hirsutum]
MVDALSIPLKLVQEKWRCGLDIAGNLVSLMEGFKR